MSSITSSCLFQNLATQEWPARVSSVQVLSIAYAVVEGTQRKELLQLYLELCNDETPMVRRAAAQVLVVTDLLTRAVPTERRARCAGFRKFCKMH